jgi:hypothetical protein
VFLDGYADRHGKKGPPPGYDARERILGRYLDSGMGMGLDSGAGRRDRTVQAPSETPDTYSVAPLKFLSEHLRAEERRL